jgi:hypothetical protein
LIDPTAIVRPILDTVDVSHDVEGASYEEFDDAQAHFYCACKAQCFASSVATPRGNKAGSHSCATYIFLHDLPSFPRLLLYG